MSKGGLSKVVKDVTKSLKKHSPEILTGVGIVGMGTAIVFAVRATPKALQLIELEKEERGVDKLKPMETVKATWKCYIPTAVMAATSTVCLIGASSANLRRNAALATAYALSESTLKDYQKKVVENIGEKKEQAVRDAIAKDKIDRTPLRKESVVITGRGNTLCFDSISGRYFESDIDKIKKSVNDLNLSMLNNDYISLNEFYYELGLEGIAIGDDLGWNVSRGYIKLDFSSQLAHEGVPGVAEGTPCLVIDYELAPRYDYR